MKPSKLCLLYLLVVLLFFAFPHASNADESKISSSFQNLSLDSNISYVCVQFKDFPFMLLWQLKGMASSFKQELPEGLSVGREKRKDQGYLLVSYQQKKDGVLLSMSLHQLTFSALCGASSEVSPLLLSQQRLLNKPSDKMIVETLRELFSSFILSWEKGRITTGGGEIALYSKISERLS